MAITGLRACWTEGDFSVESALHAVLVIEVDIVDSGDDSVRVVVV